MGSGTVWQHPGVIGAEVNVGQSAVTAVDEIQCPPALVPAVDIFDRESVHIGEQQQIVDGNVRVAVLAAGTFGKTVVFPPVQDGAPPAENADISVGACGGSAGVGAGMLVAEHVAEGAGGHGEMAVVQDQGEIRGKKNGFVYQVVAGDHGLSGAVCHSYVDHGTDGSAVLHRCLLRKIPFFYSISFPCTDVNRIP